MAEKRGNLLIVDDDEDILVAGKLLLKNHFENVTTLNDPNAIPELMTEHRFDVILLDMNFGPGDSDGKGGFLWLRKILELDADAVVIMITAHGSMTTAIEAMKLGATDFIAKPWHNEKVVATLTAGRKLGESRNETKRLKRNNQALVAASQPSAGTIVGSAPATFQMLDMIERAAPTDANVLLLGENGTGKELAARALHSASQRSDKIFMSVDLGAISENLFESELFGHKKGAFTGAHADKVGRLVAADGGTLFLDELGNLPLHLQAKLLTVLEQREVTPVGGRQSVPINVRVIAATNMPKAKLYDEGHFRQDLLFRLNTVEIHVPALRERAEDIPILLQHYAAHYARKYNKAEKSFSDAAMAALTAYHWPGNIRALRHAVERAVILSAGEELSHRDFALSDDTSQQINYTPPKGEAEAAEGDLNLERLESHAVKTALTRYKYNVSHAAKELGLTRAALYRRMEKYGL